MPAGSNNKVSIVAAVAGYYLGLVGLAGAGFVTGRYWWGFAPYAYVNDPLRLSAIILAAIIPIVLLMWSRKAAQAESEEPTGSIKASGLKIFLMPSIIAIVTGGAFWLFRARAHYLGDGYTLLSTLALDNPFIKYREIGEAMAHLWLKQAFGSGEPAALMSFQLISVGAGVICVLAAMWASVKLFETTGKRLLFASGVLTGGYMLLFFGYVENYSLLVSATMVYGLVGLLGATGKINRWWAVVPLLFAILMHVLAVVLVPSGLYLLLRPTVIGHKVSQMTWRVKSALVITVVVVSASVFLYLYNSVLFFQLAFVPMVANRFTIEGYTLFSSLHLADVGNLIFILIPALVVILPVLWSKRKMETAARPAIYFLLLMTLGSLAALFVFDPKLGMPRDWDLFSFAGVPTTMLLFYLVLSLTAKGSQLAGITCLAITLNMLVLIPRVVTQTNQPQAVEQFRRYIYWDHQRNQNALGLLVGYYRDAGDSARAQSESEQWHAAYPEWGINRHGLSLANSGQYRAAIKEYHRVIRFNPVFPAAYGNIGAAHLELKEYDSAIAYMEIARGMNPYNSRIAYNYGASLFFLRDFDGAQQAWLQAVAHDSTLRDAWMGLTQLAKTQGDREAYYEYLAKTISFGDAPLPPLQEMGMFYLQKGDYDKAGDMFDEALSKGLDSAMVDSLRVRYPQLGR